MVQRCGIEPHPESDLRLEVYKASLFAMNYRCYLTLVCINNWLCLVRESNSTNPPCKGGGVTSYAHQA